MKKIAKLIQKQIESSKRAVIIPHKNPDGDAIGSAGAIFELLTSLGIKTDIFCANDSPDNLLFIPHSEKITTNPKIFDHADLDLVILVDTGDLNYAGVKEYIHGKEIPVINIDHHQTNTFFGTINLVHPEASSTAEVVFGMFKNMNVKLNKKMATAILSGIITDTDNFTNAATTHSALSYAGELLRYGANMNLINEKTARNKTVDLLRLWGCVLKRIEKHEQTGIVYTHVTQEDLEKFNLTDQDSEGVANFLNNIDDAEIILLLKEMKNGKIRGSLRTVKDNIDVAAIAKQNGGGGHKKAAGFTFDGTIKEALEKILLKA